MELASVFKRYAHEGDGQLALKFADIPHLCKVAIEDGEAVFIKLGLLSPEDSIAAIRGKQLLDANFIKGFKTRKHLDKPITELLLGEADDDVATASAEHHVEQENTVHSGRYVEARKVSRMINDYVDIVGPLGVVMMENHFKTIGYSKGQSIDANSFHELLEKLLLDMAEDLRSGFFAKHM